MLKATVVVASKLTGLARRSNMLTARWGLLYALARPCGARMSRSEAPLASLKPDTFPILSRYFGEVCFRYFDVL